MEPFIYRECRATITARIPDTPDADQHPDRVLVQGRGTAHPQYQGGSVVFTEIGEYAIPQPIPVVIVDGELLVEVLAGDESVETQPLFLPVTVDERANQNWSWRLTFDFLTLGEYGEEVSHPPLSFPVEAGDGPLEISTVATPVIKTQGFVTRGAPGRGITSITASGGVVTVEWEGGDDVEIPIPAAAQATSSSDGLMPSSDKAKLDLIGKVVVHPDADTLTSPGRYDINASSQSSNLADKQNGYVQVGGPPTYLVQHQQTWRSGVLQSYVRRRVNGAWEAWQPIMWQQVPAPANSDLNDLKEIGARTVATTVANWPNGLPGTLETLPYADRVKQRFTTVDDKVFIRSENSDGTWTAWKETTPTPPPEVPVEVQPGAITTVGMSRPDAWTLPEGTDAYWTGPYGARVVNASYKGDGYVATHRGGYSTMLVTVAESNKTVDVSCINPATNRHVTYRLQGADNATWLDDFQLIEEAWVGAVAGGVPSNDTLVKPRSNCEFAFEIDVAGNRVFVPWHGAETAIDTGGLRGLYRMDGSQIDLSGLGVGDTITGLSGVKMRQSVYGRHPDTGAKNWVRIDQVTTISPDGMLQSETCWTALDDVKLGANYAPMTPVDARFTKMEVLGGGQYTFSVPGSGTNNVRITEERDATSVLFTDPNSSMFCATAFLEPSVTLMREQVEPPTLPMRVEERSSPAQFKLYPYGFPSGTIVPRGTVWRTGAQWRYGEL